jgi:carboxymethylenebutenolidase
MKSPRRFVSALALLVVAAASATAVRADDHADKMHHEHKHDTGEPSPAATIEPSRPVTTESVVYATLDGKPVHGYLARPTGATGALPGIVVIQEWWGLNDNIQAMTRRFAGEGYVALAVDLYEGKVATTPEEAGKTMTAALGDGARLVEHLRQARRYLAETAKSPKIGSVGWCFGGAMSLQAAIHLGADLDAAVVYYGRTVTDPAELAKIQAPLLGLFGGADGGIPVDGVRAMEAELARLGKTATIVVYDGADHAFANPTRSSYDETAATDAWRRTAAFFTEHLWD